MNRRRLVAASLAVGLAGCGGRPRDRGSHDDGAGAVRTDGGDGDAPPPTVGYTFGRPTGNRVVAGRGGVPDAEPVDVEVGGDPVRVAAVPVPGGSAALWAVVLADGSTVGVHNAGRTVERVDLPDAGLAGARGPRPPAVAADPPRLLAVDGGAPLSHPVRVGDALVGVSADGSVLVADRDGAVRRRHGVSALPDARPVTDGRRVAVLSGATTRYGHGVLGDEVEAGRVTLLDPGTGDGGGDAVTHRDPPVRRSSRGSPRSSSTATRSSPAPTRRSERGWRS